MVNKVGLPIKSCRTLRSTLNFTPFQRQARLGKKFLSHDLLMQVLQSGHRIFKLTVPGMRLPLVVRCAQIPFVAVAIGLILSKS